MEISNDGLGSGAGDWFFVSGGMRWRARMLRHLDDPAIVPMLAMWKSSFVQQRKRGLELFLDYASQVYHPERHEEGRISQLVVFDYEDAPPGAAPAAMAFWEITEDAEVGRVVYLPYMAVSPGLEGGMFETDVFAAVADHVLDDLNAFALVWESKIGKPKHRDAAHYHRSPLKYAQQLTGVRHSVLLSGQKEMMAIIVLQSDHTLNPQTAYRAASSAIGHELEIVGELGLK